MQPLFIATLGKFDIILRTFDTNEQNGLIFDNIILEIKIKNCLYEEGDKNKKNIKFLEYYKYQILKILLEHNKLPEELNKKFSDKELELAITNICSMVEHELIIRTIDKAAGFQPKTCCFVYN